MKRFAVILTILLSFAIWSNSLATTYFVKVGGNNSADGLSWANAWAHPNKTNGNINDGDTVIFAPGEWDTCYINPPDGGVAWTVYRCADDNPDDADSGRSATILRGGIRKTSWTQRGSTNIYRLDTTFPPRWNSRQDYTICLTQDGAIGHGTSNHEGGGSISTLDAAGKFWYDADGTDSVFFWPYGGGDPDAYDVRISGNPVVVINNAAEGAIKFIGLTFEEGQRSVAWIAGDGFGGSSDAPDSIEFLHCNIKNAGECIGANNCGIVTFGFDSGDPPTTDNAYARYCYVRACSLSGAWAPTDDYSGGCGIEVYGAARSVFDSNVVTNVRAGGFMLKYGGGTTSATQARNMVIAHNWIDYGRAGIWYGNRVDSLWIYGNYILNSGYYGIDCHSTGSDIPYNSVFIFNNTFWNAAGNVEGDGKSIGIAPRAGSTFGDSWVKYNVIFDTATVYDAIGFEYRSEAPNQTNLVTYWSADSNLYYHGSGSFSCEFNTGSSCSGTNWAAWIACQSYDAHSSSTTNPKFYQSQTQTKTGLSRPNSAAEMNYTYGGRTWTLFGAWQPTEATCADTLIAPVFESPANAATGLTNGAVILDWSDSTQVGTVDLYDLQVDDNSNFSSTVFTSATAWSRDTVTTTLSYGVTYYWRTRGRSDCDTSVWSGYRTFSVDTCIIITALPYTMTTENSCYCLRDRLMSSTGNGINTNGYDDVRIRNRFDTRDTLKFGTDGGDSYEGIYASGTDNITIDGLYIWHDPAAPTDSALNNVCIYFTDCDTMKVWRTHVRPSGMNGRGIQNNSGGFNVDLWRVRHDSSGVTSFQSRCQHHANIFYFIPEADHDDGDYFVKVHACSVYNAPHNILSTTGGPTLFPKILVDSNYFRVDARNLLYNYPDGLSDACQSTGDAAGIDVIGACGGSRISYNMIRSGITYEGGAGMLLQNLMGQLGDSVLVVGNNVDVSQGPNERFGVGRSFGLYLRYVPGTNNTGSQYVAVRDNVWKATVDTDTATIHIGREAETWSLILSGGIGSNVADSFKCIDFTRNRVTLATSGTLTGWWEGSALGFGSLDSAIAAYANNGNIKFSGNRYIAPRTVVEIGNMQGIPGNNWQSVGDTIDAGFDTDSTITFDRSGSYINHSRNNRIRGVVYVNGADDASVAFDVGGATDNDTLGLSMRFEKTLTALVVDAESIPVASADVWIWNDYGDTVATGTTNGSGLFSWPVLYKFLSEDKFPADTYVLSDSTAFNPFTIKAKSGSDSVQVELTVTAAAASDTLQFPAVVVSGVTYIHGLYLKGVRIK